MRMIRTILGLQLLLSLAPQAANWPQWRGPLCAAYQNCVVASV
jgi:hypothetical protein